MTYALGINKIFTIEIIMEIILPKVSLLHIERTAPVFMDRANFLDRGTCRQTRLDRCNKDHQLT